MKGSITVFFSLIFLVVIAFLGGLFFFGRSQLIQTGIRKDADAAGYSTLAEYQEAWVKEYGLYGVKQSRLEPAFGFYMEQNSQHGWGSYRIDELKIMPVENLQDAAVLQRQIEAFMQGRGFLEIIEEVIGQLGQIQETEQEMQGLDGEQLEELGEIQSIYAQLVTDVEGIRNDGGQNPYSIRALLEKEPSREQVQEAVKAIEPDLKQIGVLEKAYDEIEQVGQLCQEAEILAEELAKRIDKLKQPEQMPVTAEQLRRYRGVWQKNKQICVEVSEELKWWLSILEQMEGEDKKREWIKLQQAVKKLERYDRSIRLPYEYQEGGARWDFKRILNQLKGYSVEVGELAPDQELDLGISEQENTTQWEEIPLENGLKERFLLGEYILGMFQNFQENASTKEGKETFNLRGHVKQDRFLQNEVEFLIQGTGNEYRNVDGVRTKLMLLRTALNMGYLLSDATKRTEIHAAASIGGILLPGIGNSIAFGLILTIWGRAEAIQDYQILIEGGKVPLWKTADSWKSDLSTILSMQEGEKSEGGKGLSYRQYLRFLIYLEKPEVLLQRIQKIIALNAGEADLQTMVTGFLVEGEASGMGGGWTFTGDYRYDKTE